MKSKGLPLATRSAAGGTSGTMAIFHVLVTGRDRRHLSELRNKFRVVVVGARDTEDGIVVDAYIQAIVWSGCGRRVMASRFSRTSRRQGASARTKVVRRCKPASSADDTAT